MFLCPSHADRHQSGSVAVGEDGRLLIKCWAGCTAEEVTIAMGLSLKDLFTDSGRSADDIRRDRQARERKRARAEQEFKSEGLRLEVLCKAENFIRAYSNVKDSNLWPDEKRNKILDLLASAYTLLERERRG